MAPGCEQGKEITLEETFSLVVSTAVLFGLTVKNQFILKKLIKIKTAFSYGELKNDLTS